MISKEDIEQLAAFFVTRTEWDKNIDKTTAEVAELKKDIAVLGTKLNYLIGILSAIGVGVLGVAIKVLFGG